MTVDITKLAELATKQHWAFLMLAPVGAFVIFKTVPDKKWAWLGVILFAMFALGATRPITGFFGRRAKRKAEERAKTEAKALAREIAEQIARRKKITLDKLVELREEAKTFTHPAEFVPWASKVASLLKFNIEIETESLTGILSRAE